MHSINFILEVIQLLDYNLYLKLLLSKNNKLVYRYGIQLDKIDLEHLIGVFIEMLKEQLLFLV
jgi:hypothetical protein